MTAYPLSTDDITTVKLMLKFYVNARKFFKVFERNTKLSATRSKNQSARPARARK